MHHCGERYRTSSRLPSAIAVFELQAVVIHQITNVVFRSFAVIRAPRRNLSKTCESAKLFCNGYWRCSHARGHGDLTTNLVRFHHYFQNLDVLTWSSTLFRVYGGRARHSAIRWIVSSPCARPDKPLIFIIIYYYYYYYYHHFHYFY